MADKKQKGLTVPSFGSVGRTQEDFQKLLLDAQQLNWITLTQGSSKIVKTKQCGVGEFVYGMDNEHLGESFVALVGPWRPIATLIIGSTFVEESYRPESERYKKIEAMANDKSQPKEVAASFGVQFLLWLPKQGIFCTYAFTKTARRRAPKALALMGKLAVVGTEYIDKHEGWYVPNVTEFSPDESQKDEVDNFIFPDEEILADLAKKFDEAPDRVAEEGVEKDESEKDTSGRER